MAMTSFFYTEILIMLLFLWCFINLLTACSSTQFFYTFANKFIQDEVEYFIDLNEKDKVLLSQQISEMVSWHRTSILPSYAIYLDEIAKKS